MAGELKNTPFERQNHKDALTYIKAAAYCAKKQRVIFYTMLVLSATICIIGICNRYNVFFGGDMNDPGRLELQTKATEVINLISGTILLTQIFVTTYLRRTHRAEVNLLELYECYIFEIPLNNVIMTPIRESEIAGYARKIKRHPEIYRNYYFKSSREVDAAAAHNAQFKVFENDYKVMNFARPYFIVASILFIIMIIVLAVSFDDRFILTLINILIPSLSIISIIIGEQHRFHEAINRSQNGINMLTKQNETARMGRCLSSQRLDNTQLLRCNQDALFAYRISDFMMPQFFTKWYMLTEQKYKWNNKKRKKKVKKPVRAATGKPTAAKTSKQPKPMTAETSLTAENENMILPLMQSQNENEETAATQPFVEPPPMPVEETSISKTETPSRAPRAARPPKADTVPQKTETNEAVKAEKPAKVAVKAETNTKEKTEKTATAEKTKSKISAKKQTDSTPEAKPENVAQAPKKQSVNRRTKASADDASEETHKNESAAKKKKSDSQKSLAVEKSSPAVPTKASTAASTAETKTPKASPAKIAPERVHEKPEPIKTSSAKPSPAKPSNKPSSSSKKAPKQ